MKKLATLVALSVLAACGGSSDENPPPALTTKEAIATYVDGKTWVMTGADIPSHPNGFSEDLNLGAASQCYQKVTIAILAGTWSTTSDLGTLEGEPLACNHAVKSNTLAFASETVALGTDAISGTGEATADCFDILVNYGAFKQEGRGRFSADRETMELELYFENQAVGATCADGDVGSGITTLNGAAFAGDAVQVYRLQ